MKSSQAIPTFDDFDLNRDGVISLEEFKHALPQFQPESKAPYETTLDTHKVERTSDRPSYSDRISDIVAQTPTKTERHPCVLCGGPVGDHHCGACCGVFCQACCVGTSN